MSGLATQPARAGGELALGGDLRVVRLGYGAMQIPGLLRRIADELAVTPAQLALAWRLRRSPVVLPIPGTASVAHFEENVRAALIELGPDEVQHLDAALS
jgi:pyridoxine 4-dehydrogenase